MRWRPDGVNILNVLIFFQAVGVTDDEQKPSILLTYLWDEMCKIYENIVAVEGPPFTQINAAFEAHFAPTSNPVMK